MIYNILFFLKFYLQYERHHWRDNIILIIILTFILILRRKYIFTFLYISFIYVNLFTILLILLRTPKSVTIYETIEIIIAIIVIAIIYYYNNKDIDILKYLNIFSKKINKDNDKMFFQTYRSILITLYILLYIYSQKKIINCFYKIYTNLSFGIYIALYTYIVFTFFNFVLL